MISAARSVPDGGVDDLDDLDALAADGRWLELVAALAARRRAAPDPALEEQLVWARHRASEQVRSEPAPEGWPPEVDDVFAGVDGLPEIGPAELRVETLQSAILHHGALVVRGFVPPERVGWYVDGIDRAFAGYDAAAEGAPPEQTSPWYRPFRCGPGYEMNPLEETFLREAGGVHTADSPRVLAALLDHFEDVGFTRAVREHFGQSPLISLNKNVLRKVRQANPSWHQDGCYLGGDIRAVNIWIALTDCGGDLDVPGLDLVPRRIDRLLPGGTHGAVYHQAIGHAVVEEAAGDAGWTRPFFAAGDAIVFDQLFVHSTDKRQELGGVRHAIESWWFSPVTFPDNQIPVLP